MKRLVLDFENGDDCDRLVSTGKSEDGKTVLASLRNGRDMNGVFATIVAHEYLIDNLSDKLKNIRDGVKALKASGFTMELLEAYMSKKGIRITDFKAVMYNLNEFFMSIK